jgi:uncharacterized ion transporter superfamily protein YfcC
MKKLKIPHVFIFLSAIILFCSILTYIVPSGSFERTTRMVGHVEQTMVIPGSYQPLPKHFSLKGLILGDEVPGKATPISLLGLFTSIPKGLNSAAALIFFVFIIGAVLNLIQHTGAINVFIKQLLRKFRHSPTKLSFILFISLAFSSTFLGMGTEFIPLIPIFLLISKSMGFDRLYAMCFLIVAVDIGWATAITNPFTVQIAQQIAEVPIGSGMLLRVIFFVVSTLIGFAFMYYYGKKIKRDKTRSVMPDDPFILEGEDELMQEEKPTKRHIGIAITALVLFALILFAVQTMGWGLIQMTGGFFTVGLVTILISGMSGDESMKAFVKGLEVMIVPALIVGFARGIQVVMQEGLIIDTILHQASLILEGHHKLVSAEGMYVFQTLLNFFIPSASGQAMVSMPLMVPLSDLMGISRQTAVLAFCSGDGFSNMIIPTNGVTLAMLAIAGIPYEKWFKFIWPLFLILALVAGLFIGVATVINY